MDDATLMGISQDLFDRLPAISIDPEQATHADVFQIAGNLMLVRKRLLAVIDFAKSSGRGSEVLLDNGFGDIRYEQGNIAACNRILEVAGWKEFPSRETTRVF